MSQTLREDAFVLCPLLSSGLESIVPAFDVPLRPSAYPADDVFRDLREGPSQEMHCVSTHIFPGAWPRMRCRTVQNRQVCFEPAHVARPAPRGKEAIDAELQWYLSHNQEAGFIDVHQPETFQDQDQLWLAANRYVRARRKARTAAGFTLLCVHANGLNKETFEPVVARLFALDKERLIEEAWAIDGFNQGDSSLLNRAKLGDTFHWADSARDILNFILQYLPAADGDSVPRVLPRLPVDDSTLLSLDGHPSSPLNQEPGRTQSRADAWRQRKIVVVGHSAGGTFSSIAFSSLPSLIGGLVLIDPITPPIRERPVAVPRIAAIAKTAIRRRDRWDSRETAAKSIAEKRNFFGRWHPAVLSRYIDFALTPASAAVGQVELKTRKQDETLLFADAQFKGSSEWMGAARLTFLPQWLRERTLFIHPVPGGSAIGEEFLPDIVASAPGASQVRVDAGHLMVQERPREVAEAVYRHLQTLQKMDTGQLAKL